MSNLALDLEMLMLSDEELRRIYGYVSKRDVQPPFLQPFAVALLAAGEQDFRMLRSVAITLAAKYNLGWCLVETAT